MIPRKFLWILSLLSLHLARIAAEDPKPDEEDWVPITPSNATPKKAEGRVLNLDTPNQNFFPGNEYVRKRQPQQYLQETSFQKGTPQRGPKPDQPYKFEPVIPLHQPQFVQQPQIPQYVEQIPQVQTLQQVQQLPTLQRVPQEPTLLQVQQLPQLPRNQEPPTVQLPPLRVPQLPNLPPVLQPITQQRLPQQVVPPPNPQFYDDKRLNQGSVGLLNQELIGAIQNQRNPVKQTTPKLKEEKETVQLLYVPLESLKSAQPVTQASRIVTQTEAPRREKTQRVQALNQFSNIQDDFIRQALAAHKLQQQLQEDQPILVPSTTTTTTPAPKKRKPNQPPLAVFMENEGNADVKDVLKLLKDAKSISVQDNAGPGSPKVFVGPSNIEPEGYTKFPLPYLSTVQGNRIERKVDQLPFFVAPLSYKTPNGYSKIPLPSPHVGSVVVSIRDQLLDKDNDLRQPQTAQNQIVQDFDIKQPFQQYGEEPRPDYYQPNQNGVFGFGNDYNGFPGNVPQPYPANPSNDYQDGVKSDVGAQNYDEVPTKQFVPNNYQTGLRESPNTYYETTPVYKPVEEKNNQNYPDYQNEDQRPKVRDYDVPTLTVESKTTVPNYRNQPNPEIEQFINSGRQNFETPKTPANVYSYNEEPIRQTVTTSTTEAASIPQTRYKITKEPDYGRVPEYSRGSTRQRLPAGINQYEIEQINNQFNNEKAQELELIRSTTPIVSTTHRLSNPNARGRTRSRQRLRTTTTSTTPNALPEENYTVLEEFNVQPKTSTFKYTTEVETIPAKVYKLDTQSPEPVFVQNQSPVKPQNLNQEALDQQVLRGGVVTKPVADFNQQLLANAPSREPIDFDQPFAPSPNVDYTQEAKPNPDQQFQLPSVQPKPSEETERPIVDHRPEPQIPIVYSRGQEQPQDQNSQDNPYLPGLVNNLQDQAIRPLLIPNLLAPTTERSTVSSHYPTEEIQNEEIYTTSTTESPRIETTTQRRSRGRQRAHSRQSTTSAPRRSPTRRRPTYTRPTTERSYATTEAPQYESTRRSNNQRQRFRTRGRQTSRDQATERVLQTTENTFRQPALEGGFQASSGDPQSYPQYDSIQNIQQIITVKPEQSNQEAQLKEYHQVYSLPAQVTATERVHETARPVVTEHVVTTPSETSRPIRIKSNQSGGVYNNRNNEVTPRSRPRIRSRTRSRGSSTTPRVTTTTTLKPQVNEEEESYGFLRNPSYEVPAVQTEQPLPVYSASYQHTPKTLIQLNDGVILDQTEQPQFVGQIRPKYTTTEAQEVATEAPRSRSRARVRVPSRKTQQQHQAYNEVKSQPLDDQVTRRSNVVRTRSRGKSHFKLPERVKESTDYDVEGGNYPVAYKKSREATSEKPSFHITVDPSDEMNDDQEPHPSLYSPQVFKNVETQWVEASILPSPNQLDIEDKQTFVTAAEETTDPVTVTTEIVETTQIDEVTETETAQTEEEEEATTTEMVTTTEKKKKVGRRRGVWKLVKQRPVDGFETAESQNYYSVLNSFDNIEKKNLSNELSEKVTVPPEATTKSPTVSSTEGGFFETIYSMLGMASRASQLPGSKIVGEKEVSTTTPSPTFPEEYTPEVTTQEVNFEENKKEKTTTEAPITTTTPLTTTSVKNYDVEPWELENFKTSTSTEISHETEICYKGKCVKSKDADKNL